MIKDCSILLYYTLISHKTNKYFFFVINEKVKKLETKCYSWTHMNITAFMAILYILQKSLFKLKISLNPR